MQKYSINKYRDNLSKRAFRKVFVIGLLILFGIYLFPNCSSGNETGELKKLEGVIKIVGNEPFTYPSLQISKDTSYVINCTEEERNIFFEHQGRRFAIYYKEIKLGPAGNEIEMIKFEKLNNN